MKHTALDAFVGWCTTILACFGLGSSGAGEQEFLHRALPGGGVCMQRQERRDKRGNTPKISRKTKDPPPRVPPVDSNDNLDYTKPLCHRPRRRQKKESHTQTKQKEKLVPARGRELKHFLVLSHLSPAPHPLRLAFDAGADDRQARSRRLPPPPRGGVPPLADRGVASRKAGEPAAGRAQQARRELRRGGLLSGAWCVWCVRLPAVFFRFRLLFDSAEF